jgi:hypothetical protein
VYIYIYIYKKTYRERGVRSLVDIERKW